MEKRKPTTYTTVERPKVKRKEPQQIKEISSGCHVVDEQLEL